MPLCKKFFLIRYQCFTTSDTIKIKTVDVKFWSHLLQSRVWFQSLACSRKWLKYFLVFQHSHNHLWLELLFIPKMLDKPTYQFKCQWHLNRCSKNFWTNTYILTHAHNKIKSLYGHFLDMISDCKTFQGIRVFLICHNNNFGTYCIDVRVVTCFDTDLWLGHSSFSYLAIVQAHAHEVSSQMICSSFILTWFYSVWANYQ